MASPSIEIDFQSESEIDLELGKGHVPALGQDQPLGLRKWAANEVGIRVPRACWYDCFDSSPLLMLDVEKDPAQSALQPCLFYLSLSRPKETS